MRFLVHYQSAADFDTDQRTQTFLNLHLFYISVHGKGKDEDKVVSVQDMKTWGMEVMLHPF